MKILTAISTISLTALLPLSAGAVAIGEKLCDHNSDRGIEVRLLSRDADNKGLFSATGYSEEFDQKYVVEGRYNYYPEEDVIQFTYMKGFGQYDQTQFTVMTKEQAAGVGPANLPILVPCN